MSPGAESLRRALRARGVTWHEPLDTLESVDSTNLWLRARACDGRPSWSAVTARTQSAGRGRRGRSWTSSEGGMYLSVLCPAPSIEAWGLVGLVAGTATARAVGEFVPEVCVKWPNDVLRQGRKVGGVLAEACGRDGRPGAIVVGVGVNVRSCPVADESAIPPASMVTAGIAPEIVAVAAAILEHLRLCYDALLCGETRRVLDDWRALSVAWWGRRVTVRDEMAVVTGRLLDVDGTGGLVIETESGERRVLCAGDVAQVRPLEDDG